MAAVEPYIQTFKCDKQVLLAVPNMEQWSLTVAGQPCASTNLIYVQHQQ